MKHSIISMKRKWVFSIKNAPSFTTINQYGLFMGLDMTMVITMKTITSSSIGLVITGTDYNDTDSKQIVSACHTWSWQANCFGDHHLWSTSTLSWFRDHTFITRSLALIVLQLEAADLARSIKSIKLCSIWEYGPDLM